jgi:hypothetical protein
MDEYFDKVIALIAEKGWAVQAVLGAFVYSVGLTARKQPELIIVGNFDPKVIGGLINAAIDHAEQSGEHYGDWTVSERILRNHAVVFREVTQASALRTVLVAKRLYGNDIRLMQMFLPDQNGHFPWDPECEDAFNAQASLEYVSTPEQNTRLPVG